MTQLWKNQHLLAQYGNGVILANCGALATVRALGLVYAGNQEADILATLECRFKKKVRIRRFDVTIQK